MNIKTAIEICPTTTMGRVLEGALLVDVREKHEVERLAFDVPNLINIPYSEFELRYNEIPKDKEIIMVCEVGSRSLNTTYYLMNHGWENVTNMQYGMQRWVKKGFRTIGDTASVSTSTGSGCGCNSSAPEPETNVEASSCCSSTDDNTSCC